MTLENNNKKSLSDNNIAESGRSSQASSSFASPTPPEEKNLKEAFYKRYGVCYSATWGLVRKIAGGITLSLRDIYNTLLVSNDKKKNGK